MKEILNELKTYENEFTDQDIELLNRLIKEKKDAKKNNDYNKKYNEILIKYESQLKQLEEEYVKKVEEINLKMNKELQQLNENIKLTPKETEINGKNDCHKETMKKLWSILYLDELL
jgi:hypothetical protein